MVGAVVALSLFGGASSAQASSLTVGQVQAIITLLQSFGTDQATIDNVRAALNGATAPGVGNSSNSPASNCLLSTNLSRGATDATTNGQVSVLQDLLGVTPVTGYFGPLTETAVQTWQTSHNILSSGSPSTTGWGVVGPKTRAAMATRCIGTEVTGTPVVQPVSSTTTMIPPSVAPAVTTPTATTTAGTVATSSNPNLVNLDKYVAKLGEVTLQSGLPSETVALIQKKARDEALTMNFQQVYAERVKAALQKRNATTSQSMINRLVQGAIASIQDMFAIHVANAFVPTPFGGFVTYVNPVICDCDPAITQLFVAIPDAPPPVSNIFLTYLDGSEAFPYYTLPLEGVATVGFYSAAVQACYTYIGYSCILVPSFGQITPVVGSSLVP